MYLACFHFQRVLDPGPACEEVSVGQAGQLAWADCSGRMRREEDLGNLGQEEGHREACHNQAVGVRIRSREQRLERLGNHEVHQDPGSEPVVGIAAAVGQEGSRKEGRAVAAGQAGRGIGEAADGVSVAAVAGPDGLTASIVSLDSILVHFDITHRAHGSELDGSLSSSTVLPRLQRNGNVFTQAPSASQSKLFQTVGRE